MTLPLWLSDQLNSFREYPHHILIVTGLCFFVAYAYWKAVRAVPQCVPPCAEIPLNPPGVPLCPSQTSVQHKPLNELHEFTVSELRAYRGETGTPENVLDGRGLKRSAILISANGEVYDATSHPTGLGFYGPGCAYHLFAGNDATVPLATMELKEELCNRFDQWHALKQEEKKILADWIKRFRQKYQLVGVLKEGQRARLDLTVFGCAPWPVRRA